MLNVNAEAGSLRHLKSLVPCSEGRSQTSSKPKPVAAPVQCWLMSRAAITIQYRGLELAGQVTTINRAKKQLC